MSRVSAGLLMYRVNNGAVEVFLAHPGGPFFATKDEGHWTIPKGETAPGEDLLLTAQREFEEEIGCKPTGPFWPLGSIKQKGGKVVHAWAFAGDYDPNLPIRSNVFTMEWPLRSGKFCCFPEVDRAQFFSLAEARQKIKDTQEPLLDRLLLVLQGKNPNPDLFSF